MEYRRGFYQKDAVVKHLSRCVVQRFEDLAALCGRDAFFPTTEAEWHALVERADAAQAAEGGPFPDEYVIDPVDFEAWCRKVEIIPGVDALRAYVIVQRARLQAVEISEKYAAFVPQSQR